MPYILDGILVRYHQIQEPFSGVFEYSFAKGEQAVFDTHRHGMAEATASLRRLWQAWLRDMILLRWPEAASSTTTWARLAERGLSTRPDDFDDFF